jgi:hypothetical protein
VGPHLTKLHSIRLETNTLFSEAARLFTKRLKLQLCDVINENVMSYLYHVSKLNAYGADGACFTIHTFQLDNRWRCFDYISYYWGP